MARRRNNPNPPVDWSKWDQDYTFEYKDANMEMLQASDPYWIELFESQDKERQDAILRGELSLLELEEQRQSLSDADYKSSYDSLPEVSVDTPIEGETPEEAALRLESEPIGNDWDALKAQVKGNLGVASVSRELTDLDALVQYETPEQRAKAREAINKQLGQGRGREGADMRLLSEMARIDQAEKLFNEPGVFDREIGRLSTQMMEAEGSAKAAEEYLARTNSWATRTVGDAASSYKSLGSVAGAVVGGIAAGPGGGVIGAGVGSIPITREAYAISYAEARLAGLDRQTANQFAASMAASEFAFEFIGGKLGAGALKGVAKNELKKWLQTKAGKGVVQVGTATLGAGAVGYAEEAATEALQTLGAAGYSELTKDPEFKTFLRDRAPRNEDGSIDVGALMSQINRSGMAGLLQTATTVGAIKTAVLPIENAARTQEAILNNTIHNEEARTRFQAAADRANNLTNTMAREAGIEGVIQTHNELLGTPKERRPEVEPYLGTSPLEAINTQYQGAGGGLSTGLNTSADSKPLTARQRGDRLRQAIEGGMGPTIAQEAPQGPSTALSDRPATPVAPSTPVTSTAPTVPSGPTGKKATKGSATKPKAKGKKNKVPNQEALLNKIEGLSSTPESRKADVKPAGRTARARDIIASLVRSGSADTDSLVDLVNKGQLGIVDTEADLPDGVEMGRDGWYDPKAKRVYLVADKLSPESVRGTALHEVNHFLNRNKKDPKTKTGINNLISGNIDSYNTRITRLAEGGNKIAKAALERAKADGNVREELTSYFASEALDAIGKKGALGQAAQIFRDIKSAINTTARNKGIAELSDNDISYILRRQVEDADSVEFTDDGDGRSEEGLASIIGENAKTYEELKKKFPERPYKASRDNKNRLEISDKDSFIKSTMANALAADPSGQKFKDLIGDLTLDNFLHHPELFKAYPQLADVKIAVDKTYKSGDGAFDPKDNTIYLSAQDLAASGGTRLKSVVLHEVQHAIQLIEDFDSGANFRTILQRKLLENKSRTVPLTNKEIEDSAWDEYQRAYGEAEARLSESNYMLTDEELNEVKPEERMTTIKWDSQTQSVVKDRLHPLRTLPGSRLVQRANSKPLPRKRSSKAALTSLPAGLASIKSERGGNFDPFFVRGLINDFDAPEGTRLISGYLNKHAGTPADPLKDVEIPNAENVTWEFLWDKALAPLSKAEVMAATENYIEEERQRNKKLGTESTNQWVYDLYDELRNPKIPDDAPIWGAKGAMWCLVEDSEVYVDRTGGRIHLVAAERIGGYLDHVSDYLLTVPPDKLKQYDLVRAVRETVAADEAARKKAEKQKAIQDSKLKTYIQFPDGYRWVQLTQPGQFAAESDMMGHSVRGYEPYPFFYDVSNIDSHDQIRAANNEYSALERQKAVSAVKVQDIADRNGLEVNPEWQEDSLGGSTSYGYGGWDAIKKDSARIYSLRDPKGKSVVTVELGRDYDPSYPVSIENPDKLIVSQIKGAYNNAPTSDLHPKIQDLIRNLNEENLLDLDAVAFFGDMQHNAGVTPLLMPDGTVKFITPEMNQILEELEVGPSRSKFFDAVQDTLRLPPTTKRLSPNGSMPQGLASISGKDIKPVWKDVRKLPLGIKVMATHGLKYTDPTRATVVNSRFTNLALSTQPPEYFYLPVVKFEGDEKLRTLIPQNITEVFGVRGVVKDDFNEAAGLASISKYSKSDVSVWDDTAGSIIKMLFLPNKGIGEEAFNTREYWRLKSAGLRDKAEGIAVRIEYALKKDGKDAKEFEEATLKAESQKTPVERERALDALVRNFGNAAKEYRQGRMLVDQLSKEIVKDWYNEIKKTGRKASKAELATMNTILEKLGQYTHRVYLSDLPSTGKTYANSIMSIYDKGDANNPYFQTVQDAVDYLLEHEVGIAPREELVKKKIDTVRRTYQTWIGKGDNLTKFEMIDALDAKRAEVGQKEMDAMVRKVVREMLGLDDPTSTSPISRFYRAGALDEGILQHRERVPKVLRELLGEVTNPGQRILTTISAQADLLYKNRMLSDYYDNWEGKLWVKPGDRIKPGNEKFTEQLKGGLYGPLEDMWVTKTFAFAIRSQRTQIMELKDALIMAGLDGTKPAEWAGGKIARGIGLLSTVQKLTKTAFDIGAWSLNGFGSWWSLLKDGQLIGTTKASRDALRDAVILAMQGFGIEHKHNKETNDRLSVLLEHGIPDSVFTAELRDAEKEFFGRLLEELNKEALTDPRKAWAIAKKGVRGIRDTYGLLDSWVKIADFYGQQKYYTEYHKANGDNLTEEQINRKAADTVKKRNITYSRAPIAVQTLERAGATVFATFAAEVVRTTITTPLTIKDALKMASEAKTPKAKNIAMLEATKIGVGYTTAMAIMPAVIHQVLQNMWNGEDDDEEKAKAEREAFLKLWFETDRDQSYVVLGKNANGGIVLFNAARIDPNGHTTDFVRAAAQNDDPEEYWEAVKNLFTNAAGNGYADDVMNMLQGKGAKDSMLADTFPRGQKELQDIFEWGGSTRDAADRVTRVIDNFVPTTALRLFPGYNEEEGLTIGAQNKKYVVTEAASQQDLAIAQVLAATGMRLTVVDPVKVAGFEVNTFNVERARNVTAWNRLMERDGITPDDVARTALNIYTSEIETARRMAEVYSGLDTELAGVNPRKVLKDANLNAEDINDAALARYRSEILSASRLRESEKRQLSKATDSESRRRIRENYRLARQTLADLQLETR